MLNKKKIVCFILLSCCASLYTIFDKDVITGPGSEVDQNFTERMESSQDTQLVPLPPSDDYSFTPEEREIDYNKTYDAGTNEQPYAERTYSREAYEKFDFGRRDNRLGVPYFKEDR